MPIDQAPLRKATKAVLLMTQLNWMTAMLSSSTVRNLEYLTLFWSFLLTESHHSAAEFAAAMSHPDFNGMKALSLIQSQHSMDYGEGSKRATSDNEYIPEFFLDMICFVGIPLRAIGLEGGVFDNVTFTLRLWQSPYTSRHIVNKLPFELTNRTFRLATGGSREIWFVVFHPKVVATGDEVRTKCGPQYR